MSLILRDAQYLCWKTFKKISKNLGSKGGEVGVLSAMMTDLPEKAGNLAAVVKALEASKPDKPNTKEMLATELSDMLYVIFVMAEHYGINLEDSFLQTMNDRILKFVS